MKKIWSYLAVGFAFFSAGLIVMRELMGEQIKVSVRKVKNKDTSGTNSVTVPINIKEFKKRVKRTKEERKQDRLDRKGKK